MNKIHTKLLVFLGAVICSLCLVFGLSACANNGGNNTNEDDNGGDGHTHTFGDLWLPEGDEGHYQLATCHPTVKSDIEPHVDENENEICDVCDYNMHVHTYAEELSFDQESHWYAATCSHNLTKDNGEHDFAGGVCECGVTEDEVAVYAMYKAAEGSGAYSFAIWLKSLKNDGVTEIKVADSGDALYYYDDTYEVAYFAQRTVTAKATAGGEPLAHVWFSIQLQSTTNTTIAAVETDANGEAVITFTPVSYSGDNNTYVLRIPEAMNIPGNEDESILPIPRKYIANDRTIGLEIDENVMETTTFNFGLTLSNDWMDDAVRDTHPYDRTYGDLASTNPTTIIEKGKDWTIEKTTGNGYMDYFDFEPMFDYSKTQGNLDTIIANVKRAAQGNYKLSFATESDAEVYLVYWNYNLSIGGFKKNEDKSPADEYVGSISGVAPQGSAIEKKYTGENYVIVRVSEEFGTSRFYLGLYTSKSCSVTISVERIGDYEEELDETNALGIGEENKLTDIEVPYARTVTIPLKSEVVAGRYMLTLKMKGFTPPANYAYATIEGVRYYIYRSNGTGSGEFKGIIEISEGIQKFALGTLGTGYNCDITLEKYEVEITEEKTNYYVPVTPEGAQVAFDTASFAGKKVNIWVKIVVTNLKTAPTVMVKNPDGSVIGEGTASINLAILGEIAEDADYLTFEVDGNMSFTALVSIEVVNSAVGSLEQELEFTALGTADFGYVIVSFTAGEAGDYVLTLSKHEDMSFGVITVGVAYDNDPTNSIFGDMTQNMMAPDVESKSETLTLGAGETVVLRVFVFSHLNMTTYQDDITLPFKCNLSIQKAD
ncbi:MAG: hypothetical protein J1F61_06065 [Clostridiales bacterium]|nr:hypothetical protein [Clostridiales bacterium]